MFGEHAGTRRRQSVRTASIGRGNGLDETLTFESSKGFVETARRNSHSGKLRYVPCQGVPVLLSIGQAGEYQVGHARYASSALGGPFCHQDHTISVTDIL